MISLKSKMGGLFALAAVLVACGSGSQLVEFGSAPDPDSEICTSCQDNPTDDGGTTAPTPTPDQDAGTAPAEDSGPTTDQDSGTSGDQDADTGSDSGDNGGPDAGTGEDSGPPAPTCGDGTCNGDETCSTCSRDCGECPPPPPSCGDGTCNGEETCSTCAADCGQCPPPPPPPEDNKCKDSNTDESNWSCGHRYGCCVSTCAHTCHKEDVKTKGQCRKYQGCFKECQEECKEAKDSCEDSRGKH